MSNRVTIALVALAVGALVIWAGTAMIPKRDGDVRSFVDKRFQYVGEDTSPAGGRAKVYQASQSPLKTANIISDNWKPAKRDTNPSGVILRYQRDWIGIFGNEREGSRIYVARERDAYRGGFFYGYVGGHSGWGTYSGPRARYDGTFRGGGPGAGK